MIKSVDHGTLFFGENVMAVLCFTLFLFGLMLIIIYLAVMKRHTRCTAQTQGTLKQIRENISRDISRTEYHYSYSVNGTEYHLKTFDPSPQAGKIGDECIIWYDPKKPKVALAHRYKSYKAFKLLLIGGIVMIALTFLIPFLTLVVQTLQS